MAKTAAELITLYANGTGKQALETEVKAYSVAELDALLEDPALADTSKPNLVSIRDIINAARMETQFFLEGTVALFSGGDPAKGTEITIARSREQPSRIEMVVPDGEAPPTIELSDVASSLGVSQEVTTKLEGADITFTDFFVDTKSGEYAFGLMANNPTKVLDAFGLDAVTNVLEVRNVTFFMGKSVRES